MTKQGITYTKIGIGVVAVGLLIYYATRPPVGGSADDPTHGDNDPNFDAHKVAIALRDTMSSTGTDEEEILSILKFVTPEQFDKVFKAFGKWQYNATLGNQINPLGWFTQLPFVDLKGWLKSELSASEYNVLKTKYPKNL